MNKMNRPFQLSSRRSDFAHQNFDLIEEPDFFTDEHLHEHFRNLEIDLEIDDYDHFDQPRVHEPSWGNSHRRCRRRRRIKSDAAAEASPSMADILGHDDSVATSLSSSSSSFLGSVREDDLSFSFLLGAGRDSISLASRRGVPALLSVGSRSRDEEDDNESFAKDFPFLNRDSLSLASRRGVPKSFFSEGEDDDCGGDDDASDHSHFFVSKNDGEEDYDEAASCIRGKSDTSLAEEKERDNGECDAADLHSLDDLLLSGWDSISETRTRSIAGGRCSGTSETSRTISPLISRRLSDMILEDGLLDRHSDGYDLFVSWPHKD